MFDKIKSLNKVFGMLLSLIGITLIFVGGMFSSKTKIEKNAEYVTDVVVNHTKSKSLCALTVGKTESSGPVLNPDSEFHNTYGTFMQSRIAFASVINPDKELMINFENIQTDNLSFLYGGGIGTISYNNHFKHNTLPIETMFADERMYDISNYVIYISQSQADSILDSRDLPRQEDGLHTESEYNSLLKQLVPISINGIVTDFVIQNIYYQFNYYYDSLSEVMGDFIIFSYYLPDNLRDIQRNMYFMDEYVYHNKYFMNYISSAYPSHNYSLKINHYNIVDDINDDYFLSFYYEENSKNYDWLKITLDVIAISLLLLSLFLVFFANPRNTGMILYSILHLVILLIPYLLFSTIYKTTGNIYFLSEAASKTNLFVLLAYGFIYIMLLLYGKRFIKKKKTHKEEYYEISI